MSVDIEVRYEAPPDFGLSPPYYRPGSYLILSCIATGASDSVAFRWTSTNSLLFTYGARNAVHSSLLTAYDSGTHTCTITDTDRTTASARVKVFLYGKQVHLVLLKVQFFWISGVGLYVFESYDINQQSIANNTALFWHRNYGDHHVYVECYSNSTTDTGTLLLPDGFEYSSYSSTLSFCTYSYDTPIVGIYT